ncbi:MAG: lipopolysaccharide biosynthesis protein [Kiritimatiellia bacterium]
MKTSRLILVQGANPESGLDGSPNFDDNLQRNTPREALFWSAADRIGLQLVQLILSIVMARILMPSDYGLVGMITLFLGVADLFVNGGFSAVFVQRQTLEPDHIVSVFYLNVAVGVLMALGLLAIAPLVAEFYRQPILVPLTCAMGVCTLIGSFGVVPSGMLYRAMDLRRLAWINFTVAPVSGVVGVAMAIGGFGVWSLVGQRFVATSLGTVLYWWHSRLRLRGRFHWNALQEILPFSLRILGAAISGSVSDNLCNVAIGRFFRPADVGFYTRAFSLARLPMEALEMIFGRVFFPMLSRVQDDPVHFKRKSRSYLQAGAIAMVPMMALLAAAASPIVICLLTAKWLPCVPYLQLFSLAAVFWLWQRAHTNILLAKGLGSLLVRVEIAKRLLQILVLVGTVWLGMLAVVCGQVAVAMVGFVLHAGYAHRVIRYTVGEQCRDLLPVCLIGAVVTMASWGAGKVVMLGSDWVRLLIELAAGIGVYAAAVYLGRNGWAAIVVEEVRRQKSRIRGMNRL